MLKMKKMLPQPRSFWPRSLRRLAAFVALATTLGFLISPGLPLYGAESIEFLPPPMEGTISLGVYDSTGKLVRVLHREADLDEFRIALNGLVTKWDGNDDSGAACPAGTYRVRGYRVGELQIEGIEFHGNDWSEDEEAPRIVKLTKMAALPDGSLLFNAELAELAEAAEPQRFILAPQAEEEATESTESTESTEAPEQP